MDDSASETQKFQAAIWDAAKPIIEQHLNNTRVLMAEGYPKPAEVCAALTDAINTIRHATRMMEADAAETPR